MLFFVIFAIIEVVQVVIMQRYFAKDKNNENFILYDSDIHHIKNVMRGKVGDQIEVVYNNQINICNITNLEPLELKTTIILDDNNELNIDVTIAVALVSEQKFDLILQKLTELGVTRIIPLKTERSIVKLDDKKIEKKIARWQLICKEASEQSKRNKVSIVDNILTLDELSKIAKNTKLICSLSDDTKHIDKYLTPNLKEILFAIGPEGGFSQEEEAKLLNGGFKRTSLGKQVFRVETAAIYVASIINYRYGG